MWQFSVSLELSLLNTYQKNRLDLHLRGLYLDLLFLYLDHDSFCTHEAALFQNILNFWQFCPNFEIFYPFFWKIGNMPLLYKICPADVCMNLKTLLKSDFLAITQPWKQQIIWNLSKWVVFLKINSCFIFAEEVFAKMWKFLKKTFFQQQDSSLPLSERRPWWYLQKIW